MTLREDRFELRTGKARRETRQRPASFVKQILRAAHRSGRSVSRCRTGKPGGVSFGRGSAATLATRDTAFARRVVIKTHIVRHTSASGNSLGRHINYLERDGVARGGEDARMFDHAGDKVPAKDFAERCADDRHHFRFMVSPEDAVQLQDLRALTRELMSDMERDLGTKLDWQAVDHWNTDNPHVHILVRGIDDTGQDLVISRGYISHGMRARAEERVSLELGPRSEREIAADIKKQITAERWTKLDQALTRRVSMGDGIADLRPGRSHQDQNFQNALRGRAQHLEKMKLARQLDPARWSFVPDMEDRLRELGTRGDIIKTMHNAMARSGRRADVSRFSLTEVSGKSVVGKFVARGLHDELRGEAFAIVDGVDGRSHYLRFGNVEVTGDAAPGAIVELRNWKDGQGRRARTLAVRSDFDLTSQVTADGATWIDRQLVAKSQDDLGGGFGKEVASAMERRVEFLTEQGLAKKQGGRVVFARNLIVTLRKREIEKIASKIERETRIAHRPTKQGEYLSGTYSKRLQLASGRFAMVESISEGGKSFELVPWRPALEKQLGKPVQGQMMPGGRVDWSVGRQRGLSR
ncbi:MAG: DUF3363 domain-containing protein [Parasphingorhabdus sp.]|uniref:relaxase/mobilization nuclease domain-containing protein n=1 Tax=Parasphingorhabdus sp. TaxID=2709688 RepID=UPI003001A172